jgi:sulfur carrier protein ThiS adenylyltransferase
MNRSSALGSGLRRYERQTKLSEIGLEGQAKLCESSAVVGGSGFAGEIEARYVAGAGVMLSSNKRASSVDLSCLGLRHSSAAEVGEGALRALITLRRVLGIEA